jgi:hypothetical protein
MPLKPPLLAVQAVTPQQGVDSFSKQNKNQDFIESPGFFYLIRF